MDTRTAANLRPTRAADEADEATAARPTAGPLVAERLDVGTKGPWFQMGEPHGLHWNRYRLPVPGLPADLEGLRILHVTDFHLRARWYRSLDPLLARIAAAEPDLLLATGDFADNRHDYRPALPFIRRLVAGFRARLGCFGITGNHDQVGLADQLDGAHFTILEHRRRVIEVGGASIDLIGLPGHDRADLRQAFLDGVPGRADRSLRIVLSHHPDHVRRTRRLAPDLFLAGHTHGGQVCLPGGFPILRHDTLPRRMVKGVHRFDDAWLVVNRGFGFSGPPVRLFCPAEVIELHLTRATA